MTINKATRSHTIKAPVAQKSRLLAKPLPKDEFQFAESESTPRLAKASNASDAATAEVASANDIAGYAALTARSPVPPSEPSKGALYGDSVAPTPLAASQATPVKGQDSDQQALYIGLGVAGAVGVAVAAGGGGSSKSGGEPEAPASPLDALREALTGALPLEGADSNPVTDLLSGVLSGANPPSGVPMLPTDLMPLTDLLAVLQPPSGLPALPAFELPM